MRATAMVRVGRRNAAAGQALLIAVLVLFAVATLAALFAGIVSSQLTQVARQSDVVALRNIAEAGLRLANEQLTYSPAGADWRPDASPYVCGDGQVTIQVTYGPLPDQLQSRFLRIVSTAVFPDNPFLRHTISAWKPVLLTDYARFITDKYETDRTARLGVSGLQMGGYPRQDYVTYFGGPIRSNTDLMWYGQSRLSLRTTFDTTTDWQSLGILRDDRIEVAGTMRPAPSSSPTDALTLYVDGAPLPRAASLFQPNTEQEQNDYINGFPQPPFGAGPIIPNSRIVLARLPDYQAMTGWVYGVDLSVPRVRPPEIDAVHPDKETHRYLQLTRDSGFWRQDPGLPTSYYNTGEFGWGWMNYGGIYIDNFDDIQYEHDLDMLRGNWMRSVGDHYPFGDGRDGGVERPPEGPADYWDRTGRHYAPPAVEIIVHGEALCPYMEVIRHDLRDVAGIECYWEDPDGAPVPLDLNPDIPDELVYAYDPGVMSGCTPTAGSRPIGIYDGNRAIFPFPANGVIYAEGNVRVSGIMPPVRDNQGRVGTAIPVDQVPEGYFGDWHAMNGRSRRFDLQIVSGGTIYIDDNLLSPASARLGGLSPDNMVTDRLYGSRIALLARDYVCLNTTALNPRPVDMFRAVQDQVEPGIYHLYNDAQPIFASSGSEGHLLLEGDQNPDVNVDGYAEFWDPATDDPFDTDPAWVSFAYTNPRLRLPDLAAELTDLRLMVGHSGLWVDEAQPGEPGGIGTAGGEPPEQQTTPPGTDADEPAVDVALHVNDPALGSPWPWGADTSRYTFLRAAIAEHEIRDESDHWYVDPQPGLLELGSGADDFSELLPDAYQPMAMHTPAAVPAAAWLTGADTLALAGRVWPVRHWEQDPDTGAWYVDGWETPPKELAYTVGPIAVAPPRGVEPLPVQIDALIYAQNGSWFVISGRWFNDDPDEFGADPRTQLYPGYHEPLNTSIHVYGAISENMPAELGSVADWTSKWGGPAGQGGEGFITYAFDPLLRHPRRETDDRIGYLRFPNFPITSDLVIWGERVSGPAGS
jgi:hypothetical protein